MTAAPVGESECMGEHDSFVVFNTGEMCAALHSCAFYMCIYTQHSCLVSDHTPKRRRIPSKGYMKLQLSSLLGTMTVIYHSVQLLQLIALAAITLGAQPMMEDASEGESTSTGGCISDWREMNKAYLEQQSSADVENSIFDFYPSDAINYGVLVMFYDMGPPPNTSTSGRRECCQRGSQDCFIYFLFRYKIFKIINPYLLFSLTGHSFETKRQLYNLNQLCWVPPPLCNNSSTSTRHILTEFSRQVRILYSC